MSVIRAEPSIDAQIRSLRRARESDEELMRRVQNNDPGAIEQLYERHEARALRVALAVCHDRDRAEDAVQEAFVGVWRGRMAYRPVGGLVRGLGHVDRARARAGDNVSGRPAPRARETRPEGRR